MTHEGHISLYKGDDIITRKRYSCLSRRDRIINMWRSIYGKGFNTCAIHISPVPGTETTEMGVNKNFYPDRSENGQMKKGV